MCAKVPGAASGSKSRIWMFPAVPAGRLSIRWSWTPPQLGPGELANRVSNLLAAIVARYIGQENDAGRHRLLPQALRAPDLQRRLTCIAPVLQHDGGSHDLSGNNIGQRESTCLLHIRVLLEH